LGAEVFDRLQRGFDPFRLAQDLFAEFGQHELARGALDQPAADLRLEGRDLLAHRRSAQPQRLRGSRKTAAARDAGKQQEAWNAFERDGHGDRCRRESAPDWFHKGNNLVRRRVLIKQRRQA